MPRRGTCHNRGVPPRQDAAVIIFVIIFVIISIMIIIIITSTIISISHRAGL